MSVICSLEKGRAVDPGDHSDSDGKSGHGRKVEEVHQRFEDKIDAVDPSAPSEDGCQKRYGEENLDDPQEALPALPQADGQNGFRLR
jgi:hypothetical protein